MWEPDMEWFGFWMAVSAFIVMGALNARRGYEARHETIRLMLEKGEKVDPQLLQDLLKPVPKFTPRQPPAGETYAALRVIGTIALFLAPSITTLIILPALPGADVRQVMIGISVGIVLLMGGLGFHFCTRFVTPPPKQVQKVQD
jgi:hypothetical protein